MTRPRHQRNKLKIPEVPRKYDYTYRYERGQNGKAQIQGAWRIVYVPADDHQPGSISTKARIREIREKWAVEGDLPDPKYNKPPTPHEIRAGVARRRDGGKGVVEFLPGLFETAEDDKPHHDGPEDECAAVVAEKVDDGQTGRGGEGSRHEVLLLDLPRGRVHRRKTPLALSNDGGFEWVGRVRIDDEWEMGSLACSEAWDDLALQFDVEDEWEPVDDSDVIYQ